MCLPKDICTLIKAIGKAIGWKNVYQVAFLVVCHKCTCTGEVYKRLVQLMGLNGSSHMPSV